MRRFVVCLGILVVLIVAFALCVRLSNRLRRVRTLDAMGQIYVTLSHSSAIAQFEESGSDIEVRRLMSAMSLTNASFKDSWGNSIKTEFEQGSNGVRITISSSGPDGQMGTWDDIVQAYIILSQQYHTTKASDVVPKNEKE